MVDFPLGEIELLICSSKMCKKHLGKSDILSKYPGH